MGSLIGAPFTFGGPSFMHPRPTTNLRPYLLRPLRNSTTPQDHVLNDGLHGLSTIHEFPIRRGSQLTPHCVSGPCHTTPDLFGQHEPISSSTTNDSAVLCLETLKMTRRSFPAHVHCPPCGYKLGFTTGYWSFPPGHELKRSICSLVLILTRLNVEKPLYTARHLISIVP